MPQKVWYTQTHLSIINLLKGLHVGYLSTTSITWQIDHHYINVSKFWGEVKNGSLYNPYILALMCIFVPLQLVLRPSYVLIYLYKVVVTLLSVYNYAYSSTTSELRPQTVFPHFSSACFKMAFNIAYCNATVAAFSVVYFLLKQCTLSKQGCCNTVPKFTSYSRLVIRLALRVLWVLVMGVPWQILSRSYSHSLVLSRKWKTRSFLTLPIRELILNNHQLRDVLPGVFLRIYRTNQSIWNFNPHRSKLHLINNSKVRAIFSN